VLFALALLGAGLLQVSSAEPMRGAHCTECIPIVHDLFDNITDTTAQTLTKELDKICKLLPTTVLRLGCRKVVAVVVEDLVHKDLQWRNVYTPQQFCSLLGFCLQECCLSPVIPEQVHVSLTGDPTQMVVMWTTSESTNTSTVLYGLSDDPNALSSVATGNQSTYLWGGWVGVLHTVILTDLTPSTQYYYQVGSPGQRISELVYSFVSAPPLSNTSALATYSFAAFGDMGATSVSDPSVMLLEQRMLTGQLDVVMHAGDLSYANGVESLWDDFMRKIEPVAAHIPYMVAVGNHEVFFNFSSFKHRFRMPVQESGSPSKLYNSWNYGNVHAIAYSCEKDFGLAPDIRPGHPQYEWLEQDLAKANLPENRARQPWIVLFGHRPFYCSLNGTRCKVDAPRYRKDLEPLLYKYKVDLVVQAHNHDYERSLPVYQGVPTSTNYDNPTAPVYVVSGAAGNKEGLRTDFDTTLPPYTVTYLETYGLGFFQTVGATELHWQFVSQKGEVLDHFEIKRS